jgi:phage/plasmid-like protein (TIGR03299 family)
MVHQIEINEDGTVRMAYADREIPWHRLGTPMKGLQTAEAMLTAAQANFDVVTTRVAVCDDNGEPIRQPDGKPILVPDSRATVRVNMDGSFTGLATVGTRYVVQQNRECLDYALAIAGASGGDAVVDTCGVLNGGKEFFASLDLGALVVDPMGINDSIERYLLVHNGHDGKTAITFANTSIRAVCKNTVVAGTRGAKRVFTARHTRNADRAIEQANEVLNISNEWARQFSLNAQSLLSVTVPLGSKIMDKVLDEVFPLDKDATERQQKNRDSVVGLVRAIYNNDNNAKNYGYNGWSLVNAVGEYLDHYRDASVNDRAIASMDSNSWVTRAKLKAQDYLLSAV